MTELHDAFKALPGHNRQYTPRSEYLLKQLQPLLDDALFLGTGYESTFDRFEVFYALEYAHHYSIQVGSVWGPVGRFAWKTRRDNGPFQAVMAEAEREGGSWSPVKAGLFGGSIERFKDIATPYRDAILAQGWGF